MAEPRKSWKTTLLGVGPAVLALLAMLIKYLATKQVPSIEEIFIAIGIGGVGAVARDNDKSSEEVGAKSK